MSVLYSSLARGSFTFAFCSSQCSFFFWTIPAVLRLRAQFTKQAAILVVALVDFIDLRITRAVFLRHYFFVGNRISAWTYVFLLFGVILPVLKVERFLFEASLYLFLIACIFDRTDNIFSCSGASLSIWIFLLLGLLASRFGMCWLSWSPASRRLWATSRSHSHGTVLLAVLAKWFWETNLSRLGGRSYCPLWLYGLYVILSLMPLLIFKF